MKNTAILFAALVTASSLAFASAPPAPATPTTPAAPAAVVTPAKPAVPAVPADTKMKVEQKQHLHGQAHKKVLKKVDDKTPDASKTPPTK